MQTQVLQESDRHDIVTKCTSFDYDEVEQWRDHYFRTYHTLGYNTQVKEKGFDKETRKWYCIIKRWRTCN